MSSKQQTTILRELMKLKTHPTADELYEIVKQHIPHISLGTVYRNLNQLAEQGVIQKLGRAGEQKRFDAITNKHYHFVCEKCGNYYDLENITINETKKIIKQLSDHEVTDFSLEFYGICNKCKKENHNATK